MLTSQDRYRAMAGRETCGPFLYDFGFWGVTLGYNVIKIKRDSLERPETLCANSDFVDPAHTLGWHLSCTVGTRDELGLQQWRLERPNLKHAPIKLQTFVGSGPTSPQSHGGERFPEVLSDRRALVQFSKNRRQFIALGNRSVNET